MDAFLSHSWHDPPAEKWWLLQAWRAAFVRKHGREATVWIDRCSLDPNVKLSLLLPCLPIYLAGTEPSLPCCAHDSFLLRAPTEHAAARLSWSILVVFVVISSPAQAVTRSWRSAAQRIWIASGARRRHAHDERHLIMRVPQLDSACRAILDVAARARRRAT